MRAALLISLGLALTILGVALCGLAGKQREKDEALKSGPARSGFLRGFFFAVLAGICGSMLNFGLVAGAGLIEIARRHGASDRDATNAAWVPVLFVGAIPAILYCVHLLKKITRVTISCAWAQFPISYWLCSWECSGSGASSCRVGQRCASATWAQFWVDLFSW
jgi:hypothetical protein